MTEVTLNVDLSDCVNVNDWSGLPVSKEILKLHSAYSIVLACRVSIIIIIKCTYYVSV